MTNEKTQKNKDFKELLRENGLKVTSPRLRVLKEITHKEAAISQPDLEKIVGTDIDRVTLYRILSSFEEKGIVHKIFHSDQRFYVQFPFLRSSIECDIDRVTLYRILSI